MENSSKNNRKALQLCKQVMQALNYALGACNDEVLQELFVEQVEPAPNTARLLVTVAKVDDPNKALEHLNKACGMLRCEIATAINRKKTPELSFRVRL